MSERSRAPRASHAGARRLRVGTALVLLVGCVAGAALMAPSLKAERDEAGLVLVTRAEGEIDPSVALATSAGGPFRSIAIASLWHRYERLTDEGQYYEAYQLAEWITTLQPGFSQVWRDRSYDMVFNLSAATHTREERWEWVDKGIRLLRDRGLAACPRDPRLQRQLAFYFGEKIHGTSDHVHAYYKYRLALRWQALLGGGPIDVGIEGALDVVRAAAAAPDDLDDLLTGGDADPDVARLVADLRAIPKRIDTALLVEIGRHRMRRGSVVREILEGEDDLTDTTDPALVALLADPERAGAFETLLSHLRRRALIDDHRMDPADMLALMSGKGGGGAGAANVEEIGLGALDWRHGSAHSAFWLARGLEVARDLPGTEARADAIRVLERDFLGALRHLAWTGRVRLDPLSGRPPGFYPDRRFIDLYPSAADAILAGLARRGQGKGSESAGRVEGDVERFLLRALTDAYLAGDERGAANLLAELQRRTGRYDDLPLDELVYRHRFARLEGMTWQEILSFLDGQLRRAFQEGLADGNPDVFLVHLELAEEAHRQFRSANVENADPMIRRIGLQPWEVILLDAYLGYMNEFESANLTRDLVDKSRIWRNTPIGLRGAAYPRLRERYEDLCEEADLDVDRVLPAPR